MFWYCFCHLQYKLICCAKKCLCMIFVLLQGNMQRCKLVMDQVTEARDTMMKVLDHKDKVLKLLNKNGAVKKSSKLKRKERAWASDAAYAAPYWRQEGRSCSLSGAMICCIQSHAPSLFAWVQTHVKTGVKRRWDGAKPIRNRFSTRHSAHDERGVLEWPLLIPPLFLLFLTAFSLMCFKLPVEIWLWKQIKWIMSKLKGALCNFLKYHFYFPKYEPIIIR